MVAPHLERFSIKRSVFIAGKNSERQIFQRNIQIIFTGKKFKTHINGFFFEIVAQTPVAEHFKKGQMHGIAHIVDIAGTHTLLHVSQSGSGRMLGALEEWHQRMHTCSGEKAGGVVIRYEWRAFNNAVTVFDKKVQIFLTNSFSFHNQFLELVFEYYNYI